MNEGASASDRCCLIRDPAETHDYSSWLKKTILSVQAFVLLEISLFNKNIDILISTQLILAELKPNQAILFSINTVV